MSKTLRKENRKSVPKTVKKESKIKQRAEERKLISRVLKGAGGESDIGMLKCSVWLTKSHEEYGWDAEMKEIYL